MAPHSSAPGQKKRRVIQKDILGSYFKQLQFQRYGTKSIIMVKKTNVLRLLDQQKISYQTVTYPYDSEQFTPEKMQEFIDFDIRLLYKTLVGKGNKSGFLVGVIPKNKSLNFKVLSKK